MNLSEKLEELQDVDDNESLSDLFFDQEKTFTKEVDVQEHSPVSGILLCYWNNIIGPHALCVWHPKSNPDFTKKDQLRYLTTHILTSSDAPEGAINTKLLFLRDRDIIVSIFLFTGYHLTQKVVFALSLVVPYSEANWFLAINDLCTARLTLMISKLRILLEKDKNEHANEDHFKALSDEIPQFLQLLADVKKFSLPVKIELEDTIFASGQRNHLDFEFTKRAIASHLQTCGCSIVVGESVQELNMMLYTLGLFLSPGDRQCSILLTDENVKSQNHRQDVLLQGFLKSSFNLPESIHSIMLSQYPTTLIDMTTLEVKKMFPYHEHEYWRQKFYTTKLQELWLDEHIEPLPILQFNQGVGTETLVSTFLKEMFILHPIGGIREAFLQQFMRVLDRKAFTLIKYVEDETQKGKYPSRVSARRVINDLDLKPEGNFWIVIARGERLQQGIYSLVCDDRITYTNDTMN